MSYRLARELERRAAAGAKPEPAIPAPSPDRVRRVDAALANTSLLSQHREQARQLLLAATPERVHRAAIVTVSGFDFLAHDVERVPALSGVRVQRLSELCAD